MSGGEIFVIILVAILLFGTKRIPEVARGLGKGLREFKKATDEIKREIAETEISKDINGIKKNISDVGITKEINEIKKGISETGISKEINDITDQLKK